MFPGRGEFLRRRLAGCVQAWGGARARGERGACGTATSVFEGGGGTGRHAPQVRDSRPASLPRACPVTAAAPQGGRGAGGACVCLVEPHRENERRHPPAGTRYPLAKAAARPLAGARTAAGPSGPGSSGAAPLGYAESGAWPRSRRSPAPGLPGSRSSRPPAAGAAAQPWPRALPPAPRRPASPAGAAEARPPPAAARQPPYVPSGLLPVPRRACAPGGDGPAARCARW
jgi:hypothetical protein